VGGEGSDEGLGMILEEKLGCIWARGHIQVGAHTGGRI
jgi:hypothetical protein